MIKHPFMHLFLVIILLTNPYPATFQHLPPKDVAQVSNFCTEASSRKACPVPPTYDSIIIEKYLGKWYEIGSTARMKLQNEAGLVCYQANYSLGTPQVPGKGARITIVNSGFPKLGAAATLGVTRLSTAATGVCANAKHICALLAPESPIRQALYQISRVVVEISATYPGNASVLSQAIVNISSSLQMIESGLSALAANVTVIQLANGKVSQSTGNRGTNVESINRSIRLAMSQQCAVTQLVVDIGIAKGTILEVATSLVLQGQYTDAVTKLLQAADSIDKESQKMLERLTDAELELVAMGAASASIQTDESTPSEEWTSAVGQAVQNYSSSGKLVVSMQGFSGPYWIIDLDGSADGEYSAALVYSCVQDQNGEVNESLFILSRAKELAHDKIDRFLNSASLYGISTNCQNPFLQTLQDSGACDPSKAANYVQ